MGAGIESLCAFHAGERYVTEPTFEPSGVDATLRALLADVLGLGEERAAALTDDSGLFGELPEFDSMAVATVLTEMEDRLGKYHTAAQLQQNPTPREGVIFKKSDWRFYHAPPAQMAKNMEEIIWSWDCAFKGALGSDNVAGLCIGRKGADKYLLARVSEKMTFSKTLTQVQVCRDMPSFARRTVAVLVEDKANGPAVIASSKNDLGTERTHTRSYHCMELCMPLKYLL